MSEDLFKAHKPIPGPHMFTECYRDKGLQGSRRARAGYKGFISSLLPIFVMSARNLPLTIDAKIPPKQRMAKIMNAAFTFYEKLDSIPV